MKRDDFRADEQRAIEEKLFECIRQIIPDVDLISNADVPLLLTPGTSIRPDFYSEAGAVIGEVFAHRGTLKPGQKHKIAMDILKMLLLEEDRGSGYKKYIVVCSSAVQGYLEGKSALAAACKQFGIRVLNLEKELSQSDIEMLESAQRRQNFYPIDKEAEG